MNPNIPAAIAVALARGAAPDEAFAIAEEVLAGAATTPGDAAAAADPAAIARALETSSRFAFPFAGAPRLADLAAQGQVVRRPGQGLAIKGDIDKFTDALLGAVSPERREALVLRAYWGFPESEIARLLRAPSAEFIADTISGAFAEMRAALDLTGDENAEGDTAALRRALEAGLRRRVPPQKLADWEVRRRFGRDDLLGKTIAGFRLDARIGAGGMGTVYRAHQISVDRPVAVKVLMPRFAQAGGEEGYVERFIREAKTAARLNHPHIVRTYDAGVADGVYYLVMELVEGESLRERLRGGRMLPPAEAAAITAAIARALEHAQRAGIVHRDIKPDNILIDRATGTAKLADLGLARHDETADATGTLTLSGAIMGTPNYMSPEQARDTHSADARSDIYSLGATFAHMLTGRVPFEAKSPMEVITRVLSEDLDIATEGGIPAGHAAVVRRMTAHDPEDRYESASELLQDLDDLLAGRPPARVLTAPVGGTAESAAATLDGQRRPAVRLAWRRPDARGKQAATRLAIFAGIGTIALLATWVAFFRGGPDGSAAEKKVARKAAAEAPALETRPAPAPEPEPASALPPVAPPPPPAPPDPESEALRLRVRFDVDVDAARAALATGRFDDARAAAARIIEYGDPIMVASGRALAEEAARGAGEVDRKRAIQEANESYRAIRAEVVRRLADLDPKGAAELLDGAAGDPGRREAVLAIQIDRADLAHAQALADRASEALRARAGRPIALELRDGVQLAGTLRTVAGGGFSVTPEVGETTTFAVGRLATQEILTLAGSANGSRLVLLVARAAPGADAAIAAFEKESGDRPAAQAYREKLALAAKAWPPRIQQEKETAAAALLAESAALFTRAVEAAPPPPEKERRKLFKRIEWLDALLAERFAATAAFAAGADAIKARGKAIAELVPPDPDVLAKIFRVRPKVHEDGRVELAYDFARPDAATQKQDWLERAAIENKQLRDGMDRLGVRRLPAPYEKAEPWSAVEGGLIGAGWNRLVWRGRFTGDVHMEVAFVPVLERNAVITLSDEGGSRHYFVGLGYQLPQLPEALRPRFPDLFRLFDPWRTKQDAIAVARGYPTANPLETRAETLQARRQYRLKIERTIAPNGDVEIEVEGAGPRFHAVDNEDRLHGGSVGLAAYDSGVVFRSVKLLGRLDRAWLDGERKKIE